MNGLPIVTGAVNNDGSGLLTYTTRVSRKVHIVPPLTETLEKWTGAGILNAAESEE